MNTINCIIVEDSLDNLETLRRLLIDNFPSISIVGEAGNISKAKELIKDLKPDLVFLDIQLKKGTSFDLLEDLQKENAIAFEIIFVTAYGLFDYATKAIEFAALDFITKPIEIDKLIIAVERAIKKIKSSNKKEQIELLLQAVASGNNNLKKIAFHLPKGIIEFIEIENIIYLEADEHISYVYLNNAKRITAMKNLGFYSALLIQDYNFFQISNKNVVNLDYVKKYSHAELTLTLSNSTTLFASRRGGQKFREFYNTNRTKNSIFGKLF